MSSQVCGFHFNYAVRVLFSFRQHWVAQFPLLQEAQGAAKPKRGAAISCHGHFKFAVIPSYVLYEGE